MLEPASILIWAVYAAAPPPLAPQDARRDIGAATAILAARCEACHDSGAIGSDGGLDVSTREGLLAGGDLGPSIVPGHPEESLLIAAIEHTHETLRMPKRAEPLPRGEIDVLVRWIRAGAEWPTVDATAAASTENAARQITEEDRGHWSFLPLRPIAVPQAENSTWPRGDIDQFVLAALTARDLEPSPEADLRKLIRRVTYDLTGLPPTEDEVESFVESDDPRAYAALVDRLISSDAYGERWARWWLDVARYAEDDCRSLDPKDRGYADYPNAFRYRDWVVRAFDEDFPFDDFVTAQLSADLQTGDERARNLPALGFLGLGPWYYENASIEVTKADERDERIDVVSRGLLGLTISCARCHDHKFDPITTHDYHALAGVFASTVYREYPLVGEERAREYDQAKRDLDDLKGILRETRRDWSRQVAWSLALDAERYIVAAWHVLGAPGEPVHKVCREAKLDRELLDRWVLYASTPREGHTFLDPWFALLEADGSLAAAEEFAESLQARIIDVMLAKRRIEQENEIRRAQALTGTKPAKRPQLPSDFETADDACPGCQVEVVALDPAQEAFWTDLFDYDRSLAFDPGEDEDGWRAGVLAFYGPALDHHLTGGGREALERLADRIRAIEQELPEPYPYVHGVADVAVPRDLELHERGSPFHLGAPVPRRFPVVLDAVDATPWRDGSGRRQLAAAITRQPLFDRVVVNRTWQALLGRGIVASASHFGRTGDAPTHPELLDWLAFRFRSEGRSLRWLHRAIVMSATYRQSSASVAARAEDDPDNRWLWRGPRRRMTAEELRDSVLAVAGRLDTTLGGPSERLAATSRRRALYAHVSRFQLHEFQTLFDVPSPSATSAGRFETHGPSQQLFLANSEFIAVNAEALAEAVGPALSVRAWIDRLYRRVHGRAPVEAEISAALDYLGEEARLSYSEQRAEPVARTEVLAEVQPEDQKETRTPRTPHGRFAAALLGSTEFLYID